MVAAAGALTVFLGDLEPGCQVWVKIVLPVKAAPRVDVGFEGEAGEEGEPDGGGLQDLFRERSDGLVLETTLGIPGIQGLAGNAPGNAASKGATCELGGSSYVAVSAASRRERERVQSASGKVCARVWRTIGTHGRRVLGCL